MNVYITKINGAPWNPLQYRQWMTAEIAHGLGFREMGIFCYNGSTESDESLRTRLDGIVAGLSWGTDIVVCQFPTGDGLRFERELLNRLKVYQIRIIIFIQNAEELVRWSKQAGISEWIGLYNQAEVLIVPSLMMQQFLLDHGIRQDMKFVIQEMWDYTIDRNFSSNPHFHREIHFIGKSGMNGINNWNYEMPLEVYADLGIQGQNVHYRRELSRRELTAELSKGGFGLVWYQDEEFRQGMEYGASFDLARYLTAGIPVLVPRGISNQTLIEKNHLGLVADSIEQAVAEAEAVTEGEYQAYIQSVRQFTFALRNGNYTKKCLIDAVQAICRKDTEEITTPAKIYDPGEHKFTYTVLKESYGGNLALSWSYCGETEGFLIYDTFGKLVYETRNVHQHYFLIKGYEKECGFIVKSYVDTMKGKLCIGESEPTYLHKEHQEDAKVSMIMPAYNAEEYIVRSIDTVLAQSFSAVELILVDDGSKDHTPDIIDWYAEKNTNVAAIHQENGGVPQARNTGIKCACGDYIGFIDNDDMLHPDMVSRLYDSIKKNDCDIAVTSIYQIKKEGYEVSVQYPMEENTAVTVDEFFDMHFKKGLWFAVMVWNRLYRSSLVKTHLFPNLIGDDDAWSPYILSYAERICYLDDCSYEYDRTIRSSTLVDRWRNTSKEERFMIYQKIIMFFLENGNPKRRIALKRLAKMELLGAGKSYAYEKYEKLWEQIEETF